MKHHIFTLVVLLSINAAFAETYVCSFRQGSDAMRVKFDFDQSMENAAVTIYRNNRIQISHETKGESDGFGDGWDITLRDFKHPQYRYELFFNAMDLYSLKMTIPGMAKVETENCRR